jgi:hypothetical protein
MPVTDESAPSSRPADRPGPASRLRTIKIAVCILTVIAVGTAAALLVPLWPPPPRWALRPFRPGWPTAWYFFPTAPILLAYVATGVAVYHCVMMLASPGNGLRSGRLGYVGAGHAAALLILSLHAVLVIIESTESLFMLNGKMFLREDLYYIMWSCLPIVVPVIGSAAALGRHLGQYFRDSALALEIALIGIAAAVIAIEMTAHFYMPASL